MHYSARKAKDLRVLADTALSSLQVFDPEDHASLHSDKFKEGLSIYGAVEGIQPVLAV